MLREQWGGGGGRLGEVALRTPTPMSAHLEATKTLFLSSAQNVILKKFCPFEPNPDLKMPLGLRHQVWWCESNLTDGVRWTAGEDQ